MICPCRKAEETSTTKTRVQDHNLEYSTCCGPIHADLKNGTTPESIMRARYSAYVQKNLDFLEKTLDPQTRTNFDSKSTQEWAESAEFKGLKILKSQILGNKGVVEFKVTYVLNEEEILHHEVSQFRRHIGQWFFREGKIKTS